MPNRRVSVIFVKESCGFFVGEIWVHTLIQSQDGKVRTRDKISCLRKLLTKTAARKFVA